MQLHLHFSRDSTIWHSIATELHFPGLSRGLTCLSVCLHVSLSVHDCAPQIPPLLSLVIFSVQTAVRMSPWLLSSCEIQHPPPPRSTTLPAALLTQVIGVLISDQLRCCVTDGCTGIRCSICIIGILAPFISLSCMCSHQHVRLGCVLFPRRTHFHI